MNMDATLTGAQRRILQAIADAEQLDSDAATWAVAAGLAVQAEDGDIDLTPRGRDVLQAHPPR
ncbi:hypothetical protein [Stenotrophomonas sp. YAU14D1_LEIMI4_1]|uniref:hypothetical protein n=1 Tax=Stenotrophomonas sp. YAU14D1_LEIMI4_1 TaxID=2072407 RepID=UPI000D540B68|nr:hypothetical protein [Stenotrophomonas sp. YAU14D1_LEIMI4_1]AWH25704.1 hypothetical protein C1932_11705 [Stenotrophomonas sp. YAU14D1_LEIMI4_1]